MGAELTDEVIERVRNATLQYISQMSLSEFRDIAVKYGWREVNDEADND